MRKLKQISRKGFDVQLGAERTYRGVPLQTLLRRAGPHAGDSLLLYFRNGLLIPVPANALDTLDIFIATEVRSVKPPADQASKVSAKANGKKKRKKRWSRLFPPVNKPGSVSVDPRPVTFGANKVVIKSAALPGLIDSTGEEFSPWKFADTLVGIEFTDQAAWEHQFTAPQAGKERMAKIIRDGQHIYLKACQYCHGARDVGSTYGWDFIVPLAMHSLKKPRDLYEHVTVEPYQRNQRGLLMPTHGNLSKADVAAVWAWNKMLSKKEELNDYQPELFAD